MRQRIRTYKPEIFTHERLWDLEQETGRPLFRAFFGIISCADREGRFEWRPRALKALVLPYWDGDFEEVLYDLVRGGFLVPYTVGGRDYGWVPGVPEHQRIDHHEPKSELPAPPDDLACPGNAEARPVNAPQEGKGKEEERKGKEGSDRASAPASSARPPQSRTRTRLVPLPTPLRAERVFSLPSDVPDPEYLDDAVIAGVPLEQAISTWKHYHGAGLPERGVERLNFWLVQRAKERWVSRQRSGPPSAPSSFLDRAAERVERLKALEAGGGT